MRLLFVGHQPYIGWLISDLDRLDFFDHLDVSVIEVESVRKKPKTVKQRIKNLKKKARSLTTEKLRLLYFIKRGYDSEALIEFFGKPPSRLSHSNVTYFDYQRFFESNWLQRFDRMIVATYGGLIPKEQFQSPKLGTWNIHPSVLPELKGGYPTLIQALGGSFQTGTTIHEMTEKIDEGKIVFQQATGRSNGKTNWQLLRESAKVAAELLKGWQNDDYILKEETVVGACPSTCKQFHTTNWSLKSYPSETEIDQLVRAYHVPHLFPFIYLIQNHSLIQFLEVEKLEGQKGRKGIFVSGLNTSNQVLLHFHEKIYRLRAWMVNGQLHQIK